MLTLIPLAPSLSCVALCPCSGAKRGSVPLWVPPLLPSLSVFVKTEEHAAQERAGAAAARRAHTTVTGARAPIAGGLTGAPAGVGPVKPGDVMTGECDILGPLEVKCYAYKNPRG